MVFSKRLSHGLERLSLLSLQINDKQTISSFRNRLLTFGRVSGVRFLFNRRLAVGK